MIVPDISGGVEANHVRIKRFLLPLGKGQKKMKT
jgi:hypothetical protein